MSGVDLVAYTQTVWIAGGACYHESRTCTATAPVPSYYGFATDAGLQPCEKCVETDDDDSPTDTDQDGTEDGPDAAAEDVHTCGECKFESDTERGLKIHRTKAHAEDDEADELWCGICGAGPHASMRALSGHHAGAGHDGNVDAVEEPPQDDGQDDTDEREESEHQIGEEIDEDDAETTTDEAAAADGGATVVADRLPDGMTSQDVHDVVDELAPKPYLGEIADELGIERDRARTVVYELDRYPDVVDAARYTGGGKR